MPKHAYGYVAWTLWAAGCGASMEAKVLTRAAHDFRCTENQLRITDREGPVFRIAGCGQEETYVCEDTRSLRTRCSRALPPEREPTATLTR